MSVTPLTVIVWPAVDTVPVEAVAYPGSVAVVDGALQLDGAVTVTAPPTIAPAAAVYVNVIVRPVCDAETLVGDAVIVPEPFAALIGDRR